VGRTMRCDDEEEDEAGIYRIRNRVSFPKNEVRRIRIFWLEKRE